MNQQKTQANHQQRWPIIDKIIIYGVRNPQNLTISHIRSNQINVGILRCFTYNRDTKQIVQTTQIEEDKYEMWVYPDGRIFFYEGIKIYDSNYQIINDPEPQFSFTGNNVINMRKILKTSDSNEGTNEPLDTFYSFVLTDYELNRTYCTCLVFNQKKFVENDEDQITDPAQLENTVMLKPKNTSKIANLNSKILPKCTLNELIQDPLVLDPTSSLVYIPKGIIICSPHPCLTFQRDIISFLYMNGIKKHGDASIHKKQMDQVRNLIAKFGYPQAQKFYDQEQFLNQRQQRLKKQQKQLPIKPYQLHSKKTYLRMQRQKKQNLLNLKNLRRLQKKKLEQFYLSFAFLPELIQSKNQLQTPTQVIQIQDTITLNNLFSIQPYYFSSTCFRMPNFNILSTISKIGISNLLNLWKNAMLERQILVFSSDQFLTIQLFQTLLYLLEPLRWENIYIPFLPFHLCHHIEALGGYLIGMSKIHMNYMIEHFNLQSKVFVDLDQMIIIQEGGNANTQLPAEIQKWMIQQLQKLGFQDKQKKQSYGTDTIWNFSFSRLVNKQDQKQQSQTQNQQKTIRTIFQLHKIFYVSIFYIMNNYSSYIIQDGTAIRFNRQQYLKIFESQEDRKFSSQLIKTMMFIRLCEFHKNAQKSLKWNQSDICSLFVYCHYIMKEDKNDIQYWNIGFFEDELESVVSISSIKGAKNNPKRLNDYIDYVIKRNINQLTGAMTEWKTYKVEHYLVKYLNYINYRSPGIIKMEETQYNEEQSNWLGWLWQMIQTEQVEKQQKVKKEKLNKINDFFNREKSIVDLNKLFKNIGSDLFGSLKKNLGLNGWTNAKVIQKMKYNRENAKSSQSAN